MESIRSFIGIEISLENITKLIEIQKQLSKTNADLKLVEPQNLHITLHFLGNHSRENLNRIITALTPVIVRYSVFNFRPQSLGAFPTINNPRVIWVGIGEGKDKIEEIHTTTRNILNQIGIKLEDRKYHPHITLARVKSGKNKYLVTQFINSCKLSEFITDRAKQIILFKSTLTPQGAIYEKLHIWNLKEI